MLRHATFSLRGEGYSRSDGGAQIQPPFPSSVTGFARATFPQGKANLIQKEHFL